MKLTYEQKKNQIDKYLDMILGDLEKEDKDITKAYEEMPCTYAAATELLVYDEVYSMVLNAFEDLSDDKYDDELVDDILAYLEYLADDVGAYDYIEMAKTKLESSWGSPLYLDLASNDDARYDVLCMLRSNMELFLKTEQEEKEMKS